MNQLANIQLIASLAVGTVSDELTFTYPEVIEVVKLCTENLIAVLGVEIFEVRPEGYRTTDYSIYDQSMSNASNLSPDQWPDYVVENNSHAEEFIRFHPAGDDHVYILTVASWRRWLQLCAWE